MSTQLHSFVKNTNIDTSEVAKFIKILNQNDEAGDLYHIFT